MNLPRLSPEQIVAVLAPYQGVPDDEIDWDELVLAAAEAQRLKDEQCMREQKPVAYCRPDDPQNSTAFAWPGTDREEGHLAPLYAAPVPASQGDGEIAKAWGRFQAAVQPLTKAERVHRLVNAGDYPGMSEAFDAHVGAPAWADPAWREEASLWAAAWKRALAAPVTTKEAEG